MQMTSIPSGPASTTGATGRSHAQDVPWRELDDLVVELRAPGTADHDVGLLLRRWRTQGIRAPGS